MVKAQDSIFQHRARLNARKDEASDEEESEEEYSEEDDEETPKKCCKVVGCGVCCCLTFILLLLFVVVPAVLGYVLTKKHFNWAESLYANCTGYPEVKRCASGALLTPQNETRYMTWGGCKAGYKTDADIAACALPCVSVDMIRAIDTFNSAHDYKLVSFPSRVHPTAATVQLTGWWLTSGKPNASRIVLQHGNNANFNSRYVYFSAYLLRSMGFDCLILNLRNHGSSGKSEPFKTTWGYEYPFDLLGAWDFAVNDPLGQLGGSVLPKQVGIMGFSMGGFIAQSAFGIEPNIPAAWTDGAVFDVGGEAGSQVKGYIGAYLAGIAGKLSVSWMNLFTGVNVDEYAPKKTLPNGPPGPRPVAVATSTLDTFVPMGQTQELCDLLSLYPDKYNVTNVRSATTCNGNAHCSFELTQTDEYRASLCEFWTRVFNLTVESCGLSNLSSFAHLALS